MAMTNSTDTPPAGDDIDLLLPWYATGRLDTAERARVADAIARDPELARRVALADEERIATEELHDALPPPSGRARQDLFARIDAMEGTKSGAEAGGGLVGRIVAFFASLSPRSTALAAGFAALLILLQAGLIAGSLLRPDASFEVASERGGAVEGSFALVTFAPGATTNQVAEVLDAQGAQIVEGPYPGGIFRVRLSARPLDQNGVEAALARLRKRADVVQLAFPAGTR
jgi:anti-sigma factor RsiW